MDYLDQIFQIITNFRIASTLKRDAFEPLVPRSLQRFNSYRLVDILFLQVVTLPTYYDKLDLQIDETNTANGLGYTTIDVRADLTFLSECSSNKMLIANDGRRPDGAWFFSENRYASSLAINLYNDCLKSHPQVQRNL